MIYAIILAGGTGTRFWPLSRQNEPKQFLNIFSDRSMMEETIKRISRLVDNENIYIATNKIYRKKTTDYLKNLHIPVKNLFLEPQSKNTLAPIGVVSCKIYSKDKEAIILVLPCDHYIKDAKRFLKSLKKAAMLAKKGYIVTLGIIPDRPETGYGYIKIAARLKNQRSKAYEVKEFVEKPFFQRAEKFIKNKRYFWNSGIFIFKADTILEEIRRIKPEVYKLIIKVNNKNFIETWKQLPTLSVDYGIMEKTDKIVLLPANFGWIDLGSWKTVEYLAKKDKSGNMLKGNCIDVGSKNIISWSDNRILATVGLDNVIIVNTKDAILVCSKSRTQDVRSVVNILKQKGLNKQI